MPEYEDLILQKDRQALGLRFSGYILLAIRFVRSVLEGLQYSIRIKIMITSFNRLSTVTAPGKGAKVYVCLGINGDANRSFKKIIE
jgi:hypothetical protein